MAAKRRSTNTARCQAPPRQNPAENGRGKARDFWRWRRGDEVRGSAVEEEEGAVGVGVCVCVFDALACVMF